MKTYSLFHIKRFVKPMFLIMSLISFNSVAMATSFSETQIHKVAKLANETGTRITIRTTVEVSGSSKKTNIQVKKNVLNILKSQKSKWVKPKVAPSRWSKPIKTPPLKNKPPAPVKKPLPLKNKQSSGTLHPPTLDNTAGFY